MVFAVLMLRTKFPARNKRHAPFGRNILWQEKCNDTFDLAGKVRRMHAIPFSMCFIHVNDTAYRRIDTHVSQTTSL